jgi:molecular chaperone DnaJ
MDAPGSARQVSAFLLLFKKEGMMPSDYYVVLGVSRGANLNKIKRAYRKVAKNFHPDTSPIKDDAEKFLEIRKAYETLSDEKLRRQYDEKLIRQESDIPMRGTSEAFVKKPPPLYKIDKTTTFVDEFFEGFLPGFFDWDKGRLRSKDLYYEVVLTPQEATDGGLFPITVPVLEDCSRCSGRDLFERYFCFACNGRGYVQTEREFSLSFPPNTQNGTQAKVSLEDIGLTNTYLHLFVLIDSDL